MDYEPNDVIVLGAIRRGAKKFNKIQKATRIPPQEIERILERLEMRGMIIVQEKSGWLGKKIELRTTKKGDDELDSRIREMQGNWSHMVQLYKSKDKKGLNKEIDGYRSFIPMMIFFGVLDMVMFSMMFSMIGASMTDYVPADQMPADMGDSDMGDGGMDGDMGDGGFDFDLGF